MPTQLPDLNQDPLDEQTADFQARIAELRLSDEEYLKVVNDEKLREKDSIEYEQNVGIAIRKLKNIVRKELNLAELQNNNFPDLKTHAKINGINPEYDLGHEILHSEHEDDYLQTLLTDSALDRRLRNIYSKNQRNVCNKKKGNINLSLKIDVDSRESYI